MLMKKPSMSWFCAIRKKIYELTLRMARNHQDADNLATKVFVKGWKKIKVKAIF